MGETTQYTVDPVESIRGEIMRRIVAASVFTVDQIQRENAKAPETVPYCRITIPQGAEFTFDSQTRQSKILIVECDILTNAMTQTQLAGQLAAKIEDEFGFFSRNGINRTIAMTGWTGATANIYKFGRGTASVESDKNLYYLPVLLYVKLELTSGAKYEV